MSKPAKSVHNEDSISLLFPMKTIIDLDLLNILASEAHSYFLLCSYQSKDSYHIITYDIKGSYSLKNYIDNRFNNFAPLLLECLEAIRDCKLLTIPLGNIMIDPAMIYVKNGHLKLSVLPVVDSQLVNAKRLYLKIIRLFVLPAEIRKKLINSVKTAQSEEDALAGAIKELSDLRNKHMSSFLSLDDYNKLDEDEPVFQDDDADETTYIDYDSVGETVPLDQAD